MDPDAVNRSEKFSATFLRTLLCCTVIFSFVSCSKKEKWIEVDPAFSKYVDAYTTGMASKANAIRIQLTGAANTTHTLGEEVKETLFDISPSVKGKAIWADATTIEFKPDEYLKPNQLYQVAFKLGKVTKVPKKYADFRFSMQTVKPSFKIADEGVRSAATKNKMSLTGDLETADIETGTDIEKLLTASQNNKPLKINWQHNDAAKMHNFTVEAIDRAGNAGSVNLNWDGKPMGIDLKGTKEISVPAAGDFKVLNVMAMSEAQQYASVQFSDPIAVGQDLNGLINVSNQADISYTINGSEVKVFTSGKLDGNYTVNINAGIKNTWGAILDKGFTSNINFENKMPSVKIHGKGNI